MYPQISIILGSYNFSRYIAEAIESLIHQTLQPAEIIIAPFTPLLPHSSITLGTNFEGTAIIARSISPLTSSTDG